MVAKLMTSVRYACISKTPPSSSISATDQAVHPFDYPQPVIMAIKNSIPAMLPKNEVTQILAMSRTVHRRCKAAVSINCEMSASSIKFGAPPP